MQDYELASLERLQTATTDINLKAGELTRKDLLQLWGYLQCLRDIYEGKARDAAQRGDIIGDKLTTDYMKMSAEISAMQQKLNKEAGEV